MARQLEEVTMKAFMEKMRAKWAERKFVCVGLDSDAGKLPIAHLDLLDERLTQRAQDRFRRTQQAKQGEVVTPLNPDERRLLAKAQLVFNKRIVDVTKDIACAYKPNSAFYEILGDWGIWALAETVRYIHEVAPDVPVILDAKRADIGNTNTGYVGFIFDYLGIDAVTVHPYLGGEAVQPFLDRSDKGVIVLCRTSNPGAGEFQDREVSVPLDELGEGLEPAPEWLAALSPSISMPLYRFVAHQVRYRWDMNDNCCVVAGATYPEELAEIRRIIGDMGTLNPGIGSQGGDLEATAKAGVNSDGGGMIINNARKLIFASAGPDFSEAARVVALKMHEDINSVLAAA